MSGAPAAGAESSNAPRQKPSRRGGRGRGNRGPRRGPQQQQQQSSSQSQPPGEGGPAEVQAPPPHPVVNGAPPSNPPQEGASRSRRGPKRGGRGGSRGGGTPSDSTRRNGRARGADTTTTTHGGRRFEGRLTRPGQTSSGEDGDDNKDDANGQIGGGDGTQDLRADAPAFVPGAPANVTPQETGKSTTKSSTSKAKAKAKTKAPPPPPQPPKVTTKSTAPDIATRIHEDIAHTLYECPICTGELGRRSRVWGCGLCWTVFHLSCVKKWSKNEGSAAQDAARRQADGDSNAPRAWRCPGCNLPHEVFPSSYTCWCEKEVDPRPLAGLPPHSCGQTCARARKGCPHPCDATCHAGPCSPCTAMGPTQDCFCGRNSSTKRCQDTDYDNGWSCGEICGDLLPCGEHTCTRPCHEGLCGSCEVRVDARCYCGKVETEMLCSSKEEEMESRTLHPAQPGEEEQLDEWIGCFNCGDSCNRPFDCGVHFCQKGCHPQDAQPAHCPRSPDIVSHCPCGKTQLTDIPGYTPRTTCEDPVPNCLEVCGKMLPCGHACDKVCHTGACGACMRKVPVECRCGRNTFITICHQGTVEPPHCFRPCKAGLHCGRHACGERCCPGEQKAMERQAMRRKLKAHLRPSDEDVEAEHICTRVCGRLLKCERHTCPEICHKGPCNTCREAIFDEIACNCGRSVLYPPLPCGTQPPSCSHPCERPKPCGHPQTPHNCHTDDESCPKCPYLTEKPCLCGKQVLKNQPCWLVDARCGRICGAPLKCGSHMCQKNCHRPGECEDADKPCQQPCGKTKTMCGHACTDPCHAPYPCPEKAPCPATVTVTCGCGRLRQQRRCGAAKAVAAKGQVQQTQRLPALTPLTCDDECSRLERNRTLAGALGIDINPATTIAQPISSTNLPYSAETLDQYIALSSSSPLSTLQSYESTLHSLATSTTQRSVRFQPAKSSLRAFAHSLATDWGFNSESFDPEPHRHVFILKPTTWTPPPFGLGAPATDSTPPPTSTGVGMGMGMGIGGISVGECVKLRERHRFKEREAQRAAAAEAKAQRDAAKAQQMSGASEGGGWAQVAASSSRRGTPVAAPSPSPLFSGSMYAALAGDVSSSSSGKKEKLVLRSGVGAGKQLKMMTRKEPVADSWEEEEEKEEEREMAHAHEKMVKESAPAPVSEDASSGDVEVPQEVQTAEEVREQEKEKEPQQEKAESVPQIPVDPSPGVD